MIYKTNGIVLRTVKYGETSVIATIYTELFGVQAYMVKGVRRATKKSSPKSNYFQPAAILELEVYHNELKNIQFVKEYEWAFLYKRIFFNVVRNAVALYITELLLHCIKQPEHNPELFYLAANSLHTADDKNDMAAANISLYFTLQLAVLCGFQLQGIYSFDTPILDAREGIFIKEIPRHTDYLKEEEASITSSVYNIKKMDELENISLNKNMRRHLLHAYLQYLSIHIPDMGELKTLSILQEIL